MENSYLSYFNDGAASSGNEFYFTRTKPTLVRKNKHLIISFKCVFGGIIFLLIFSLFFFSFKVYLPYGSIINLRRTGGKVKNKKTLVIY